MAIDFNKPVETDSYLNDILTSIRDNIEASITALYTGASNIPDRTIRYNEAVTPPRWEKYVLSTTTWTPIDEVFATGTIMIFGGATAPTGWTRKADWTDNAMLVFSASGTPATGGTGNPKDGHVHAGGEHTHGLNSHTHTGPSHSHTGPSHNHDSGSLKFATFIINAGYLNGWTTGGTETNVLRALDRALSSSGSDVMTDLSADDTYYTKFGSGNTGSDGTGATGTSGTANTGGPSVASTVTGGTANTAQNTTPIYQEVIAATKD